MSNISNFVMAILNRMKVSPYDKIISQKLFKLVSSVSAENKFNAFPFDYHGNHSSIRMHFIFSRFVGSQ